MTNLADIRTSAIIGGGVAICGITPKVRLTRRMYFECFNCERVRLVARCFSGSGWYGDSFICTHCGEDLETGYRPFSPRWRQRNIRKARDWITTALPAAEFDRLTREAIKEEMGWDE